MNVSTAITVGLALLLASSPLHYNHLDSEIQHIDNSLEYLRSRGLNAHDIALYVIAKRFLGTPIPNEQAIVDYFNNEQAADPYHAWSGAGTRMFTTYRVLMAYYYLNATPQYNMDGFFSRYATTEGVSNYIVNETKSDDRDAYHILYAWCLYYWQYPPWLNAFFARIEKNLDWTVNADFHKRTHILYSYVLARRVFPNLNGIISATISEQHADGSWLTLNRPIYSTSIQLTLLNQILRLYRYSRTYDVQRCISRSAQWVYDNYKTQVATGKTCGYFGNTLTIEDALLSGILCAEQNGLLNAGIDMTFQDIASRLIARMLYAIGKAYGSVLGDAKYKPDLDINGDGKIDLKDYYATCKNYGKSW
jgi:hypothetical protein